MITLRLTRAAADSPAGTSWEIAVPTLDEANAHLGGYRDQPHTVTATAEDRDNGCWLGGGIAGHGDLQTDWTSCCH